MSAAPRYWLSGRTEPPTIKVPPKPRPRFSLPPLLQLIFHGEFNPYPPGTFAWRQWILEEREGRCRDK